MDRRISASVSAPPARTIDTLSDLGTYPEWLSLVTGADPVDDETWMVTLRARLGPLARSKRLRMTRTHLDATRVRFERNEVDGREHAEWILEAAVAPAEDSETSHARSEVVVHLHYSGSLWSGPLEIALSAFEGSAAERLDAYLSRS
ncbi:MAG: SRPBCC family protein [Actinomycetota bacterium]